jgi:hypothetical protein
VLGLRALMDLWNKGLRGGKSTVRGVIVATLLLVPFLWHGYLAVEHPLLSDVSTNPYEPPRYITAQRLRQLNADKGMNQLATYDDAFAETLIAEYPRVGSRRYNAGPERVLASVKTLLADRSWKITGTRGVAEEQPEAEPVPEPGAEPGSDPEAGAAAGAAGEGGAGEPSAGAAEIGDTGEAAPLPDNIVIEAVATTPIFGFRNDIVIQIASEAEATLVDMRASSRYGAHDFGYNARIIEQFLSDLDSSLIGIAGEG